MKELSNHIIYDILNTKYSRLVLDYVILSAETYAGLETHKEAVVKAFEIINERFDTNFSVMKEKMAATLSDMDELLQLPEDEYYDDRKNAASRFYSMPKPVPYWYVFLDPPYIIPYRTRDFIEFNELLFPNRQDTVVYRWNDDFSDYFDAGKEWWGTGLWSVYDKISGIIVIIGASTTD